MASIKDVAKKAGVSLMTASRVMNGNDSVSPDFTRRVREAAAELGYRPNLAARGLRSKQTRLLGLLVPDIENPTFASLAKYTEEEAQKNGYAVILGNSWENSHREAAFRDILLARQVDGIIVAPVSNKNHTLFSECPTPVVALDRSFTGIGNAAPPSVTVDNREVGRLAAEHLLHLGHRFFACVTGPLHVPLFQDRLEGFRQTLAQAGYALETVMDAAITGQISHAVATGERLFSTQVPRPLALFCANDVLAMGAMKAAVCAGLNVPGDVSVLGVDDIPAGELVSPTLTTVRQPIRDMAVTGVTLLISMLKKQQVPRSTLLLQPELVARESTTRFCDSRSKTP